MLSLLSRRVVMTSCARALAMAKSELASEPMKALPMLS